MSYVLVPGRHHLLSNFQKEYLTILLNTPSSQLTDINNAPLKVSDDINTVIWAVTSANHNNTRRNPIPGSRREVAIEKFGGDLDGETFVYPINDIATTSKFAEYVIKTINVSSLGKHVLTPENCVIAVSTPSVIEMYEKLGFQILPLELEKRDPPTYKTERTWEIVELIVKASQDGENWKTCPEFLTKTSKASRDLFLKYDYGDLIIELFNDPILGDDGDITDTRDYATYIESFDKGANRKYKYIKNQLKNGKIVDVGCATGSIIKEMSFDENLRESDLYGIEASRQLYSLCQQRKENGEFGNEYVFFYHRNIVNKNLFPNNSVDTFTAFSLTHELESYSGRDTLLSFLNRVYNQLVPGGILVVYDVIGPDNKDQIVLMKLNDENGLNDGWDKEFENKSGLEVKKFMDSLSTYSKFLRFANDFRKKEGYKLKYEIKEIDDEKYIQLKLGGVAEFLSKKDFTDNWYSEMHETFCFWDFEDWKVELEKIGYRLKTESSLMANEWIIENRYKNEVKIFDENMEPLPYPPTNVVLFAEKI